MRRQILFGLFVSVLIAPSSVKVGAHDDLIFVDSSGAPRLALSAAAIAGQYSQGGALVGSNLKLTQTYRFEFSRHGCLPHMGCWATGTYHVTDGYITLIPKNFRGHGKVTDLPTRLLPVQWGGRQYLLWEKEVLDFCNAVNLGDEPFYSDGLAEAHLFLMRDGDEQKTVSGWPCLLGQWHSYLLPRSLYGRVLKVEKDAKRAIVITIDLGEGDGLLVGMALTDNAMNFGNDFKVVWVSDKRAVLKNRYEEPKSSLPSAWPPAEVYAGQVLSTRRKIFEDVQIVTDEESTRVRVLRR